MSLSAVIAEHSRRSDARHAVHCYTLVCPFLPHPCLVACCCKLACFGMLWTISEALPVLAGRSRAGVGAASPRRAPPDTAKSDPRPYQSQCPSRPPFLPTTGEVALSAGYYTHPAAEKGENYCSLQLEVY